MRSIWDVGPELQSGALKVVLPQYKGADSVAIYAVYPCRDFMPAKVNALIDFLGDLYGPEPYWEKTMDLAKLNDPAPAKTAGKVTPSTEARPRALAASR